MELKFDPNRRRVKHCPCGKNNRDGKFCPYKGHDNCGFCHSCGKLFLPPRNSQPQNNRAPLPPVYKAPVKHNPQAQALIDQAFNDSLINYHECPFITGIAHRFGPYAWLPVVKRYKPGVLSQFKGAVVFWYLDINGKPLTGKVMYYDKLTLKRNRDKHPTWVHTLLKLETIKTGFFGEHLLKQYPTKRVMIVESEKTACIGSIRYPDYIWLATGGAANLNINKMAVLKGRHVTLSPDMDAFELWKDKADTFALAGYPVQVSTFLNANGKMDVGDYLLGIE